MNGHFNLGLFADLNTLVKYWKNKNPWPIQHLLVIELGGSYILRKWVVEVNKQNPLKLF